MRRAQVGLVTGMLSAAGFCGASAGAATFSIVATVANGPVVGAWHGGVLYGTTPFGGANGTGSLFSVSSTGDVTLLRSFAHATDGATPNGRLAVDPAGALYGTAFTGGQFNGGTVWRYVPGTGFGVLHMFGGSNDGSAPKQGPTVSHAGALYGSAAAGAVATNGMIFSLSSSGTYKALHDFVSGADGHCPFSGVAHGSGNVVYGTTVGMGFGGDPLGSVWRMAPGGMLKTLYLFTDGADGEYPDQAPTVDSAGNLYGTTHTQAGKPFAGALWTISKAGVFSMLHAFAAGTDGSGPNSPLLLDHDGDLYGTTGGGGPGGYGTLYRISPSGAFSVLHAFANGADGATPTGNLVHDGAGFIYGGTATGQIYRAHD